LTGFAFSSHSQLQRAGLLHFKAKKPINLDISFVLRTTRLRFERSSIAKSGIVSTFAIQENRTICLIYFPSDGECDLDCWSAPCTAELTRSTEAARASTKANSKGTGFGARSSHN